MKFRHFSLVLAIVAGLCLAAGAHAAPRMSGNPSAGVKPPLSEAQLVEVRTRIELANEIVRNVSADAQAKGLDDSWRVNLLSVLYGMPSGALRDIRGVAKTLDDAHAQAAEARSSAATATAGPARSGEAVAAGLGSSVDSLVFTPMAPCRFIDTRVVGGPIGTTPRSFDTSAIGPSYGGSAGCVLPRVGEPAFAANVTIANPSVAAGYLSVRPFGSTNVTSWLNWYQLGEVAANAGIIAAKLNGSSNSSHYTFEVFTGSGTANVVLDFFGYFEAATLPAAVCTTGASETFTVHANSFASFLTTSTCPGGTLAVSAVCHNGGNAGVFLNGYRVFGGAAYCAWVSQANSDVQVRQSVRCCQVP